MKKTFLLLGLFLFMASFAFALSVEAEWNENVIIKEYNNDLMFKLNISDAPAGFYSVYTLSDVHISPYDIFEINDGEFYGEFKVSPLSTLNAVGNYIFTYTVNHKGVEKIKKKGSIRVVDFEDVLNIYTNNIDLENPELTIYVENLENIQLNNLKAEFSSILFEASEEFSLGPLETKELSLTLRGDILKQTKAGTYLIESVFETPAGDVDVGGKLYLDEKTGITTQEDTTGILIRITKINKINSGNTIEDVRVQVEKNFISRFFTRFNEDPTSTVREGAKVTYTWNKRIMPAEVFTVSASTNWLFPVFIIIVIVLAVLGVKRYSELKVDIKKSVIPVKTKNGEFALKVKLNVSAKKDVENISLIDKIPRMVKLYKQFGIVKPDEIDTATRKVKWIVGDMKSGEERVFEYIVYSRVGVVGKFSLPAAKAIFEKNGNIHEVNSNNVFFLNEQATH